LSTSIWAIEPPPGATTITESLSSPLWFPDLEELVAVMMGEQELAAEKTIDILVEGAGEGEVQAGEQVAYVCEVRLRLPCEASLWQHLER